MRIHTRAGLVSILLLFLGLVRPSLCADAPTVYVIPIQGTIDLGLAGFVERGIAEAKETGATLLFEINTYGGRVDGAVQIRDAILESGLDSVAYVDKRAISAGALIALSCKKIYMAEAGTIGAAKPVQVGLMGTQPQPTDEKTVSYMRKEFKATAEQNGYPTAISEAFVDQDVEIEGLSEKGKLLTLTTNEAMEQKLLAGTAGSLEDVLGQLGMADAVFRRAQTNWSEDLVRFLTHPMVSSGLISLGLLGIWVEFKTPGLGLPGLLGALCLLAFFFGHYLVGLADWAEVALFFAGIALILVELFVTPGFGFIGLGGIACAITSLFLALVKRPLPDLPIPQTDWLHAFHVMGSSVLVGMAGAFVLYRYVLPHTSAWGRLVLQEEEGSKEGYVSTSSDLQAWVGKTGTAETQLRPAGKIRVEKRLFDAVTEGDLIEKGAAIRVAGISGPSLLVRKA